MARRLLPAGAELLDGECEVREGGLDVQRERLLELAEGADAIVADPTVQVDAELLDAAGGALRVVANIAVGHDNIDLEACRRRDVAVANTPDVLTNATAELALALTLAAARGTGEAEADLRRGTWAGWDPGAYLGLELTGCTFGVVGLGRIGRRYAELVRPLAGRILYAARKRKEDAERELGVEAAALEELLAEADVVSLHVPGSTETEGMIGAGELARMRSHAVLVNTARGSLVDSSALANALRDRRIGAAGLDVYAHEPAVPRELLEAPRAILLPHIGSATTTAREAMARLAARNVLAAIRGERPPNLVAG